MLAGIRPHQHVLTGQPAGEKGRHSALQQQVPSGLLRFAHQSRGAPCSDINVPRWAGRALRGQRVAVYPAPCCPTRSLAREDAGPTGSRPPCRTPTSERPALHCSVTAASLLPSYCSHTGFSTQWAWKWLCSRPLLRCENPAGLPLGMRPADQRRVLLQELPTFGSLRNI